MKRRSFLATLGALVAVPSALTALKEEPLRPEVEVTFDPKTGAGVYHYRRVGMPAVQWRQLNEHVPATRAPVIIVED